LSGLFGLQTPRCSNAQVFKSPGLQKPRSSKALVFKSFAIRIADRGLVPLEGKSALLLAAAQSKCGIELAAEKAGLPGASTNHSKSSILFILGGAS
jgi:hypothetical protein